MATSLRRLGELIKLYREESLLTQEQLAAQVRPPTNRSVIAHLEQGLRLPQVRTLRSICSYLEIPEALWKPFEVETFRSRAIMEAETGAVFRSPPRFIAVAGIMGSGKTTLAHKIATIMGYSYVPGSVTARGYLGDLNANPRRWAFETQLAFFCHKAIQVSEALARNERVVLDRTLTEDVNVFARYFYENGHIEKRALDTYQELAGHFFKMIPSPDVVVYCECSVKTALLRIQERGRDDQFLHSTEYVRGVASLYGDWVAAYHDSLVFSVDSNRVDWREQVVAETICREIEDAWLGLEKPSHQLSLFGQLDAADGQVEEASPKDRSTLLKLVHARPESSELPQGMPWARAPPDSSNSGYPTAYIAAPFTAKAGMPRKKPVRETLFEDAALHGKISRGKYRSALLGIEKALKSLGIASLLPHRDVNRWGDVSLAPEEVMRLCTEHVSRCELMVALLGTSHGSHYEFGLAHGMGKPCIIISAGDIEGSFIAEGVKELGDRILVIEIPHLAKAERALQEEHVVKFLQRFLFV